MAPPREAPEAVGGDVAEQERRHLLRNRLGALLAGVRALQLELEDESVSDAICRRTAREYVDHLVPLIQTTIAEGLGATALRGESVARTRPAAIRRAEAPDSFTGTDGGNHE